MEIHLIKTIQFEMALNASNSSSLQWECTKIGICVLQVHI